MILYDGDTFSRSTTVILPVLAEGFAYGKTYLVSADNHHPAMVLPAVRDIERIDHQLCPSTAMGCGR